MAETKGHDPAKESSTRGPMKGVQEDQTPAEGRSGDYTGSREQNQSSESQGASQGGQSQPRADEPSARPEIRE